MTRPSLVTKYRGTGVTECEVFQDSGGTLSSLFTYGTAGLQVSTNFKPGALAAHWAGDIYAIAPEQGIYKNIPPATSGVLFHAFTSPNTGASSYCMDWQVVLKDGKSQLFTLYHTSVANQIRMVFIDEDGVVTETANIVIPAPALAMSFMRGLNFGNKIYTSSVTTSNFDLQITDPVAETSIKIDVAPVTYIQSDLAAHSGKLYALTQQDIATLGLGNALWDLDSALPFKILEWNAYHTPGPGLNGQCCLFSDGDDLVVIGAGSGTITDEFDVWRIDFDGNGVAQGVTSVRDTVFGFRDMIEIEASRHYVSRDIESTTGAIETDIHMVTGFGETEGSPIHHYKWNGASAPATYLGVGGDSFMFDAPSWKVGGGGRTFTNKDELDFIVTDIAPTGSSVDVTYLITGGAPVGGVAMCVKYNNLKDSPIAVATVAPVDNGFTSGNYIAGLSTGASGVFRWDLAADNIGSSDVPNLSAALIRT